MCTFKEVEAIGYHICFGKVYCNPIYVFHVFPIGAIKLKCLQCIGNFSISAKDDWGMFKVIHLMLTCWC
jgi:hypothetical protein